jgi:hypothetical protein
MVIKRSTRSTNALQGAHQGTLGFPQAHYRFTTQWQQRSQPFIDIGVGRQQFREIAGLVQPLLVIAHTGFHQQRADLDFHLHHLPHQQVAVAQRAPSPANRRRGHVALRQKIAAQTVAILLASMRSFFFFAAAMARNISGWATFSAAAYGLR